MSVDGEGFTYEGFMDLMDRVYEGAGDRIEMARWPDETRTEAKRRLMREVYAADMRAKYHMPPKEFVQGAGQGLPYNTHNWVHFLNRYGSSPNSTGAREPSYRVGVYKDTPRRMMVEAAGECEAKRALQLLSG